MKNTYQIRVKTLHAKNDHVSALDGERFKNGVDFGIWKSIDSSELYIPLDVHTGNIARKLRLIKRKQNDWKTNEELISKLRKFDPLDPGKYDFALFGIGVNKEI